MDGTTWFRVRATVGDAGGPTGDLVADALWQHDPPAVEEVDGGAGAAFVAGYPSRAIADSAAAAARSAGASNVEIEPVTDDGLDAWRAHAGTHEAGPFVLVPAWQPLPAPADLDGDRLVLVLDPGRTFGSGSHPTTRLVLAELGRMVGPGASVLDVGCGSGVLAVGAALLGASAVHGIDVDPGAPAATADNAAANGVADRVTASTEPLAAVTATGRTFDVVAANLLAPVIVDLAEDLAAAVAPGGTLLLSGLLADRWPEAVDVVLAAGGPSFAVEDTSEDEGWVVVRVSRRGTAGTLPGHGRDAGGGDPVRGG